MIAPMQMSLENNDFISHKEGEIGTENVTEIGISNKYVKYYNRSGNHGVEQTVNLKIDSTLTKKHLHDAGNKKPAFTVENYNGNKSLLFSIGGNINNYIKILENGKQ